MIAVELRSAKREDGWLTVVYTGRQSTPGAHGTVLDFDVVLKKFIDQKDAEFTATVNFDGCAGATAVDALRRMGEWCLRAGEALTKAPLVPELPA